MTDQDWEGKVNQIRELQLLTQEMMLKSAQRHDSEIAQLRESQLASQRLLDRLEEQVQGLTSDIQGLTSDVQVLTTDVQGLTSLAVRHDNSIAELRAMMASLIANIDRFIQGRQTNGH